jgi:hypothetical protein
MSGPGVGVADLTIKGDAVDELKLDPRAAPFLDKLIACGGEGDWNWDHPRMPQAMREMVADLILAGILVEREHVTHAAQVKPDRLTIKITERGRNVIAAHHKRTIMAGSIREVRA